ncbi:hypothetical protein I6N96_01120 [Enterococcus sp. BWM-S5]|uniref:Uncharacterized protein n=1 Tax=Enterococcus larvae TaxID=2794352 RepID=A0ABS4CF31_9ENTE|nr:hypothetical protein [Enterococcus larvae]MBP1044862.1 hypothetical protein [Enterococcus larvae]
MKTMIPAPAVRFLLKFEEDNLTEGLSYFIKSLDGDRYYFTDLLVEDGVIDSKLGEDLYAISLKLKHDDIFRWYVALKGE